MRNSTATVAAAVASRPADGSRRARRTSVRYFVCVGILVVFAVGAPMSAKLLGMYLVKEPVPLKRPLTELDWERLKPQYRQHPFQAPPMGEEDLQKLGTDQYLQVRLVDTTRAPADPLRVANVLVTYYTGQPDMVPHTPDVCYLAAGYDPVGGDETVAVPVAGVGAPHDAIPVRVVQFQARAGRNRPTVMYFFHTNGGYEATRDGVRWRLAGSLFERYAYYAKIEVTYTPDPEERGARQLAGKAESVRALEPLLARLMPALLEDHFAWDVVKARSAGR